MKGRAQTQPAPWSSKRVLHEAPTNPPKFQLHANLVIVTGGEL